MLLNKFKLNAQLLSDCRVRCTFGCRFKSFSLSFSFFPLFLIINRPSDLRNPIELSGSVDWTQKRNRNVRNKTKNKIKSYNNDTNYTKVKRTLPKHNSSKQLIGMLLRRVSDLCVRRCSVHSHQPRMWLAVWRPENECGYQINEFHCFRSDLKLFFATVTPALAQATHPELIKYLLHV